MSRSKSLEKRLAEATPGPWRITDDGQNHSYFSIDAGTDWAIASVDDDPAISMAVGRGSARGNAELVAHSRTDLELALAVIKVAKNFMAYGTTAEFLTALVDSLDVFEEE